ncbi:Rhodanese-like protein [Mycena floridula]|nr:Rhodanese-like protein [Mycena floridula]
MNLMRRTPAIWAATRPACHRVSRTIGFIRYQSSQPKSPADLSTEEWAKKMGRDWDTPLISYEEMKQKTASPNLDTFIIDVREREEVVQGMLPSAVNLPLSVLANSLHLAPQDFRDKYGFDKPKSKQEIIFYCRSGKRAATAGDIAKRSGFSKIFNYKGSWLEWVEKEGKQ